MFVPLPSFANIEPEEKIIAVVPAALALKFIVMIFPALPVNPGFRTMPSKLIAPALLENDGS